MCGIAGCYMTGAAVEPMLEKLRHRGPDGWGITEIGHAVHGHVRLALLDLSDASAQPYLHKGGVLSFVGEIWNHAELRAELGCYETTGDTEVLAAALTRWGTDVFEHLDGMYAFAWTHPDGLTLLARDRFGKIPLYVVRHGVGWLWASERKALPHNPIPAPLPAGHYMVLPGALRRAHYVPMRNPEAGTDDILPLLRDGVRKRLHADAPVACLISGGLDSALILALALEERPDVVAYTAVYDPRSSDLNAARRVTAELGVPLVEVPIPPPTPDRIAEAICAIEIPMKAQVEIALLCLPLAERLSRDGYKAVLSGEAADELFGGYGNMARKATDEESWRKVRFDQLAKMARGNFIRTNKAFMAHGVECRLPFMERGLVECALGLSLEESPPGKGALKEAALGVVPDWVRRRRKETFQGDSGMATAAGAIAASPVRYYNAETRRIFGSLVKG